MAKQLKKCEDRGVYKGGIIFLACLIVLPSLISADVIGDAFVYKDSNTTNYGGDNNLELAYDALYSYVLINNSICSIPNQTITNVLLKLYAYNSAPEEGNYWLAYNTTPSWTESNLTYATRPSDSVLQDNVSKMATGNFVNFDITGAYLSACALGKNTSIALKWDNNFGGTIDFYSKDFSSPALRPNITIISEPTIIRSYLYCSDNYTLAHINETIEETGARTSWFVDCVNGCDNITASCAPPKYQVSLMVMAIIAAMLYFMYLIYKWF